MSINYHEKYKFLKRKLKILVYEHESLNQELEKSQRKLLKVARDNSFLLDRLLQYEQVIFDSPADSDATLSSDSDFEEPPNKKRNQTNPVKVAKQENEMQDKLQITDIGTKENQSSVEKQAQDSMKGNLEENEATQANTSKDESEEPEVEVQIPEAGNEAS